MKVLCVADHVDPLVYSTQVKKRFHDVELVLGAGDLPLEYYGFIVSSLNQPLLFVFGNHNLNHLHLYKKHPPLLAAAEGLSDSQRVGFSVGATYLEDRQIRQKNLIVVGLGGSIRYNTGDHQFSDWQMMVRILRLAPRLWWNRLFHGRFLDILLTHSPPYGIHDKDDRPHRGFKSFVKFMDWFHPRYLVHGHIHLYELNETRRTRYKDTEVVNCYDHVVLEVNDV